MADAPKPPEGGPPAGKPPDPMLAEVPSPALERLRQQRPESVSEVHYFAGEITLPVTAQRLLETCRFLRNDEECRFDLLADISGADFPDRERRFQVVYHLASVPHRTRFRLRTEVAEGETLPSVTEIWPGADWFEREIYDLFGLSFSGHPRLARILMPDDWIGYPLRKDYPLPGYPEQHLRYRTADVTRRSYVDISWQASAERAASIVKKYKGGVGAPEASPHVPIRDAGAGDGSGE